MLRQLTPTFERLNTKVAIHRDVNARNLLVYCPEPEPEEQEGALEFSLVDFGASRSSSEWLGTSEGSWRQENPTGDARYWGPASWARLQDGPEALDNDPALMWQYTQGLDMVALATCAMECLCRLQAAECPLEKEVEAASQIDPGGLEVRLLQAAQRLQRSWSEYWSLSLSSFTALAQYSAEALHGGCSALVAWDKLLEADTPRNLRVRMRTLCSDLEGLAALCPQAAEAAVCGTLCSASLGFGSCRLSKAICWQEAMATLVTLRDMLAEDARLSWATICEQLIRPAAEDVLRSCDGGVAAAPKELAASGDLSSEEASAVACDVNSVVMGKLPIDISTDAVSEEFRDLCGEAMLEGRTKARQEDAATAPAAETVECEADAEEKEHWAGCFKGLVYAANR